MKFIMFYIWSARFQKCMPLKVKPKTENSWITGIRRNQSQGPKIFGLFSFEDVRLLYIKLQRSRRKGFRHKLDNHERGAGSSKYHDQKHR